MFNNKILISIIDSHRKFDDFYSVVDFQGYHIECERESGTIIEDFLKEFFIDDLKNLNLGFYILEMDCHFESYQGFEDLYPEYEIIIDSFNIRELKNLEYDDLIFNTKIWNKFLNDNFFWTIA